KMNPGMTTEQIVDGGLKAFWLGAAAGGGTGAIELGAKAVNKLAPVQPPSAQEVFEQVANELPISSNSGPVDDVNPIDSEPIEFDPDAPEVVDPSPISDEISMDSAEPDPVPDY